jgi:hypothetical protein
MFAFVPIADNRQSQLSTRLRTNPRAVIAVAKPHGATLMVVEKATRLLAGAIIAVAFAVFFASLLGWLDPTAG